MRRRPSKYSSSWRRTASRAAALDGLGAQVVLEAHQGPDGVAALDAHHADLGDRQERAPMGVSCTTNDAFAGAGTGPVDAAGLTPPAAP